MTLKPLGANKTEISLGNGNYILVSYQTPVAIFIMGAGVKKTSKKWSATTTRHINSWIADSFGKYVTVEERPQEYFDTLLSEIK